MDRFTCPARRGLFLAFEGMFLGLRTEIKAELDGGTQGIAHGQADQGSSATVNHGWLL
jgi:hypothetical protein